MRIDFRDGERTRSVELTPEGAGSWRVAVDGAEILVGAEPFEGGRLRLVTSDGATMAEVTAAGHRRFVRLGSLDFVFEREVGVRRGGAMAAGGLEAPMPGVVSRVLVAVGEEVKRGQTLVVLEAMKMEHQIRAPRDGRVGRVNAGPGQLVPGGATLVELEPVPQA